MADEIRDENNTNETEQPKRESVGNTRLPFGLCAKYHIALPQDATPRDAWNALRSGVGLTPDKVYAELKKKEGKETKIEEKANTEKKAQEVSKQIHEKMTKSFDDGYRKNVESALSKLSEGELSVIENTIERCRGIKSGSGVFSPFYKTITVPTSAPDPLCSELGYDFNAVTFFHEYGHFVANCVYEKDKDKYQNMSWDFTATGEVTKVVSGDVLEFVNTCIREQGGKELESLARIPREAILAVNSKLPEITSKELARETKPFEPIKPDSEETYGKWYKYYKVRGYSDEIAKQKATYEADRESELYKQKLASYNERLKRYNLHTDEERKAAQADFRRMGFLTDSLQMATNARINTTDYFSHSASYSKQQASGVEAWAEYFSIKMTKDKKGEAAFKKYMPKTYKLFEGYYKNLGGMI